jgi:hypothetical protein
MRGLEGRVGSILTWGLTRKNIWKGTWHIEEPSIDANKSVVQE